MASLLQLYASGYILGLLLLVSCKADPVVILVADRPPRFRHRPFRSLNSLGGTQDSCSDAVEVSDPSGVRFPQRYDHLARPWTRSDIKAKLYKSNILYYNWLWMKSLRVRGLAAITVDDVISKLESSGCMFLAWGGAVRDAILGKNPVDIDGEVTCTAQKVKEICVRTFGGPNCGSSPYDALTRTVIGNPSSPLKKNELRADPMDITQWNSTFSLPPEMWEYTANSIGLYDDQKGNVYLFDLTGKGVKDVCARWIDITVDKDDWDSWAAGDLGKLLRFRTLFGGHYQSWSPQIYLCENFFSRYYKLRLHGFRAANTNVKEFIVGRVKQFFTVRKMQQFYCKHMVDGTFVWRERDTREVKSDSEHFTSTCIVTPFDANTILDIKTIDGIMKADFGEFYDDEIHRAISSMEMRILAAEQPDDVRKQSEKANVQTTVEAEGAGKKNEHEGAGVKAKDEDRDTRGVLVEEARIVNAVHENGTLGTSSHHPISTASTNGTFRTSSRHPTSPTSTEDSSFTVIASGRFALSPTQSSEVSLERDHEIPFQILTGIISFRDRKDNMSSKGEATERTAVKVRILDVSKQQVVEETANQTCSLSG
ncbi:unnamed protein product [Toxocara canis]|uniref:PolyA_pol domain-containing protein n=1 Tax=Toxocara canis TaxID=6265 RepID=A0A183V240_TOXCA|nr:unnamed protein product [Toxocara canis]